jgi:hypothetical protein
MKTNLLLASLAASLFSVGAWGALPEGTELVAIEDGNYYLYNESLGKFLGRGAGWGTQAILDNYGVPFSLTTSNGVSTFKFLDSANTLGNAEGTPYTDNGYNSAYLIDGGSSSFSIYLDVDENGQNAGYVSFDDNGKSKFVDSDGTTWVVKSIQERNDLVAANRLAQINAELKKAGISEVTSEDGISAALESADMALIDATGKIANADFTNGVTSWTWTAGRSNSGTLTGSNCVEVYQGTGTLSQSITVDNPGLYKVVFQAFQRAGSNANCVTVGNLGIILGNSYFSANDSYAVIPDWYTDRGGDANPNSKGDARTLFDAGKYTNDLYVYVGEDKTINLSYNIQSYMRAAWVIMDNVKLYYVTADLTSFKEAYEKALTAAKAVDQTAKMNSDVLKALQDAISASVEESKKSLVAATDALNAATANANECITAYAAAPTKFEAMGEFVKTTNAYTQEALDAYYTTPKAKYENNTLTTEEANALQDPNAQLGWHAANTVDDLLLSVWGVKDYDSTLYINTWSTEGNTDGSDFRVPFFEYWTSSVSLDAKTWTATIPDLKPNTLYSVSALVRLQQKGKVAPKGVTYQVGAYEEDSVSVSGTQIGTSDLFLDTYKVSGTSDAKGNLTINFNVKEGNNISWLAFKNLVYTEIGEDTRDHTSSYIAAYKAALDSANAVKLKAEEVEKGLFDEDLVNALGVIIDTYSKQPSTIEGLEAATTALNSASGAVIDNIDAMAKAKAYKDDVDDLLAKNNFYTEEAFEQFCEDFMLDDDFIWDAYDEGSLRSEDVDGLPSSPYTLLVWHQANVVDDLLLSVWGTVDYAGVPYINTWSTEGITDGSNFLVPFFEYWTTDAATLAARELTATLTGLTPNTIYSVVATSRVRLSNGKTDAPYGITFQVGKGTAVNVCDGDAYDQLYVKDTYAEGSTDENGTLVVKYIIAEDNNISWLSYKDLLYTDTGIPTSVENVEAATEGKSISIFNLSGQKLNTPQKGINIVDGKKVYVK